MTGTWTIRFSMMTTVNAGNFNYAYLYHNGERLSETVHDSFSGNDWVHSTGGREILVTALQGDTLTLRSDRLDQAFRFILTCFEYNANAV